MCGCFLGGVLSVLARRRGAIGRRGYILDSDAIRARGFRIITRGPCRVVAITGALVYLTVMVVDRIIITYNATCVHVVRRVNHVTRVNVCGLNVRLRQLNGVALRRRAPHRRARGTRVVQISVVHLMSRDANDLVLSRPRVAIRRVCRHQRVVLLLDRGDLVLRYHANVITDLTTAWDPLLTYPRVVVTVRYNACMVITHRHVVTRSLVNMYRLLMGAVVGGEVIAFATLALRLQGRYGHLTPHFLHGRLTDRFRSDLRQGRQRGATINDGASCPQGEVQRQSDQIMCVVGAMWVLRVVTYRPRRDVITFLPTVNLRLLLRLLTDLKIGAYRRASVINEGTFRTRRRQVPIQQTRREQTRGVPRRRERFTRRVVRLEVPLIRQRRPVRLRVRGQRVLRPQRDTRVCIDSSYLRLTRLTRLNERQLVLRRPFHPFQACIATDQLVRVRLARLIHVFARVVVSLDLCLLNGLLDLGHVRRRLRRRRRLHRRVLVNGRLVGPAARDLVFMDSCPIVADRGNGRRRRCPGPRHAVIRVAGARHRARHREVMCARQTRNRHQCGRHPYQRGRDVVNGGHPRPLLLINKGPIRRPRVSPRLIRGHRKLVQVYALTAVTRLIHGVQGVGGVLGNGRPLLAMVVSVTFLRLGLLGRVVYRAMWVMLGALGRDQATEVIS